MGSTHGKSHEKSHSKQHGKKKNGLQTLIRLVTIGLAVAAVVKEVRRPPSERDWHGVVAGFVPYDFRAPTFGRFRERMWSPESESLINPRVFGVGWTVNVGRVVALVRQRIAAAD